MRGTNFALGAISISAALTGSALAQPPTTTPAFTLMDVTGDSSKFDSHLTMSIWSYPEDTHGNNEHHISYTTNVSGQYVPLNGFGGYAGISTVGWIPRHALDIGHLELGGLFHHALSRNLDLSARVGVWLPTEGLELETGDTVADVATRISQMLWLRLSISPTYHRGSFFVRTDLGLGTKVRQGRKDDESFFFGDLLLPHFNLGVGLAHARFIATAEIQSEFITWIPIAITPGLSARYQGNVVSPYVEVSALLSALGGSIVNVTGGFTIPF